MPAEQMSPSVISSFTWKGEYFSRAEQSHQFQAARERWPINREIISRSGIKDVVGYFLDHEFMHDALLVEIDELVVAEPKGFKPDLVGSLNGWGLLWGTNNEFDEHFFSFHLLAAGVVDASRFNVVYAKGESQTAPSREVIYSAINTDTALAVSQPYMTNNGVIPLVDSRGAMFGDEQAFRLLRQRTLAGLRSASLQHDLLAHGSLTVA